MIHYWILLFIWISIRRLPLIPMYIYIIGVWRCQIASYALYKFSSYITLFRFVLLILWCIYYLSVISRGSIFFYTTCLVCRLTILRSLTRPHIAYLYFRYCLLHCSQSSLLWPVNCALPVCTRWRLPNWSYHWFSGDDML